MSKLLKWILIIALVIFIIGFVAIKIFNVQNIILKKIYPKEYEEYVCKYAKQNDVDSLLIFAIIKAESNFKPDVVSNSNAIGLMQLMDSTAQDTAKKLNIEYSKEMLYDPETNIMLGTKYFAILLEKYDNNITLALTAYNAGSGNVDKWIREGTIKNDGSDAENIPYKETNMYVRKILRDYEIYKNIYL